MASKCNAARRESSMAAATTTTLPLDVVFSILAHLPVKTLSRFRCVSQSWSALISSPSFIKSHHQRSKQSPLLFITTTELTKADAKHGHPKYILVQDMKGRSRDRQMAKFMVTQPSRYLQLAVSCLNLVCLYDEYDIYVRNPSTNEGITLTKTSSQFGSACRYCSCRKVAFAYLASTSEYKVFQIYMISGRGEHTFACEVFTLGTARWRVIGGPPFTVHCSNNAIVAEAIHFLPAWFDVHHGESNGLARFDLRKEEWSAQLLPLPQYFHDADNARGGVFRLREMRGMLSLARIGGSKMELWLLKDYDKGVWVKEYNINVPELSLPLKIEEDGRVLLEMRGGKLRFYDQKDGDFEEIYDGNNTLRVSFFVESFMSLDDESFRSLKSM